MAVHISPPSVGNYKRLLSTLPFNSETNETQFVAIHPVEDRCGGNRCVDCRQFRQDGTAVVNAIVGYSSSYYSEC